jgi:hypothetical protein
VCATTSLHYSNAATHHLSFSSLPPALAPPPSTMSPPLFLLLLFLLYLACEETAVMADKNVLSSNEDKQFDDSEAPYLILPHFTFPILPYLTLLYPTLPYPTLLYPHFTRLSNSVSILECGSKIPKTLVALFIFLDRTS